ncbi:MAG: peptide chain release factor N(5)-glutamine methyltransferase [Spirochaetia bacterium]|nr:peptide chain release factor N(5)-glutamine methyltransferase [Spirochaetia bacterium]
MTIREAIKIGTAQIEERWPETPYLDATVILAAVLGASREHLLASLSDELETASYDEFLRGVMRRKAGEPVAYITNHQEFYALDFYVDNRVLVPRADTEILVETALGYIKPRSRVLDLCTGSGCIAIAIKHTVPGALVEAADVSEDALAVFKRNTEALLPRQNLSGQITGQLSGQIVTHKSDLLNNVPGVFDVIVSNPPYLTSSETSKMKGASWPEPPLALDGGKDGLDFIRRIVSDARSRLLPGGRLLFEADPAQMSAIKLEFEKYKYNDIIIRKDLAGRDRVIAGCYSGKD